MFLADIVVEPLGCPTQGQLAQGQQVAAAEEVVDGLLGLDVGRRSAVGGGHGRTASREWAARKPRAAGITAAAAALGRTTADYILDSYYGLFMKYREALGFCGSDMVFDEPDRLP